MDDITREAIKRAKQDVIDRFGYEVVGTKQARAKLNIFDQQLLLTHLVNRGKYWIAQLTPRILRVYEIKGKTRVPLVNKAKDPS